jgi:glucose/arabinose dehydrogenase
MVSVRGLHRVLIAIAAMSLVGCGATARLAVSDGMGPNPVLPAPSRSLIPTINVVTAKGWTGEEKPVPAQGLIVVAFARGLDHPR